MEQLERLGGERFMQHFPKLERMWELMEALGHPQQKFEVVHIAGTNGKGSVSTKVARGLQLNGVRTGLTTSPHIHNFRERVQVDGEPIGEGAADRLLGEIFATGIDLSYFEAITALAFLYFVEKGVEMAVVETGLGGRLDATNVVTPRLAVITSIGLDHTEILGPDRESIAKEKGGIIKGAPLVLGPRAAGLGLERPGCVVAPVGRDYLEENEGIARLALAELGIRSEEALQALPPCRFERRGDLLLDVAHNPDGIRALLVALRRRYPDQSYRFLLAISEGKDGEGMIRELEGYPVHRVSVEHERLVEAEPLEQALRGLQGCPDLLVVCGSCFVMQKIEWALQEAGVCEKSPNR